MAGELDSNSPDSLLARVMEYRICRANPRKHLYLDLDGTDYEFLQTIGEGSFDKVFHCHHVVTADIIAIKQIKILGDCEGVPSSLIREISLLRELNHNNIIRLLNVMNNRETFVHLIFEHLDYDLSQYFRDERNPNLDPMTRKSYLHQILSAVAYCHSHKILHRDLKPKNLLIDDSRKIIKLADFGLAREFGDPDMLYTGNMATRWYRAPEILLESRQYSTPIDVWSVGCIFGEMVIGQPVFQTMNSQDELEAIFRMLGTPTEETWPGVTSLSPHLRNYAKFKPMDLSTIFPDLEPDGRNLLSMMLCLDPNKRISADTALKHGYFTDLKKFRRRRETSWAAERLEKLVSCS